MKPNDVINKARNAAKEWSALHPGREESDSVLWEEFSKAVPRRERAPGDDVIFKATFRAVLAKLRAERRGAA